MPRERDKNIELLQTIFQEFAKLSPVIFGRDLVRKTAAKSCDRAHNIDFSSSKKSEQEAFSQYFNGVKKLFARNAQQQPQP
jgi:hypothetical protein